MPFETALSGIRAASSDLSVTGNNIANASTKGFKGSRAEFGDVYANSAMGAGNNAAGSGVRLQSIAQQFTQGSISFTENELDLAISGNGFFVVRDNGEQFYTRAGTFGLDQNGYVVNNTGARLQGFPADDSGHITGLQNDIRIQAGNLEPRSTSGVQSQLNLDATSAVLQSSGLSFQTEGNAIGVTQSGLSTSTATTVNSPNSFNLPLAVDFTSETISFDVEMTASSGNNGTVSVALNSAAGVPATITSFNDLRTLAGVINSQIFSPVPPQRAVDMIATAVANDDGTYGLQFSALEAGEGSQIRLLNGSTSAAELGLPVGTETATSTPGVAAVSNGYPAQSLDFVAPNGSMVTYTSQKGASAAATASELNAVTGVSATAETNVQVLASSFSNASGTMEISINGVPLRAANLVELSQSINRLTNSTLPGISAEVDPTTGDLSMRSTVGDNIQIAINGGNGDRLEVRGNANAPSETLEVGSADPDRTATGRSIMVGGSIDITLAEGYSAQNANPPSIGLFGSFTNNAFTPVTLNAFDPDIPGSYNNATSVTIYDSLGKPHAMTQYFVRQSYDPTDPTSSPNHWVMYVQVDGQDVGDPDTSLPPPGNTLPTRASFNMHFSENGSLNQTLSDQVLISNWQPLDADGNPSGAMGPQNVLAGATVIMPDPPISSNFVIDMDGTTQFGSSFSVDADQNGFPTGRLSGLNIDDSGIIFARFTNGESKVLGQLVLADFANTKGLQPVGNTMWAENYESGPPNVGIPGSGALGFIEAGALEDSNVDLSEQLVNLIIAQRNFQASAKTIETANQVTQTILNLR